MKAEGGGVHDQDRGGGCMIRPGGGPTRGGVRECMIRTGQGGDLKWKGGGATMHDKNVDVSVACVRGVEYRV